jgi:hypothetical protein
MNRTMIKPQDIMIGDWLMAEGRVVRVVAIHQRKIGYHRRHDKLAWARLDRLEYIRITPETLRAFGFVRKEQLDGFLDDDNAWEFTADSLSFDEGSPFALSWCEEEDGCRRYKVVTRGYGEYPSLPHDAISDVQHFFYDFTHGNVLPIEFKTKE